MAAWVRRLTAGALLVAVVVAVDAGPAGACTLARTPMTVDGVPVLSDAPALDVRRGDRLRVQGTGFYELVPEAERASTTTTTVPGGAVLPDCGETRPAAAVVVSFHQADRAAIELARVSGSVLDVEVIVPAAALDGPAEVSAGSGMPLQLNVLPGGPPTTDPRVLPRTGGAGWQVAATGGVVLLMGIALLTFRQRSTAS